MNHDATVFWRLLKSENNIWKYPLKGNMAWVSWAKGTGSTALQPTIAWVITQQQRIICHQACIITSSISHPGPRHLLKRFPWKLLFLRKEIIVVACSYLGSLRVRHDWATSLSLFTFMPWKRKWQPTPVFLPGESQGRGSLVGCSLWGCTESVTTEAT